MADVKEYAYYIEGSNLALVERHVEFDNDPNSKDYGPGTDKYVWKSPLSSVTDGLELQYTYSPSYRVNDASDTKAGTAYTENGSGLLSVTTNPSMSATAGDWVLISGSDRWNGLHQVNTTLSSGTTLVLKTKYNGASVSESFTIAVDVTVMEDESFVLDLPIYLQKALVYYIKAKMSEDLRDVQGREYFNKLFLKQVEKHNSARVSGLRTISPGPNAIR